MTSRRLLTSCFAGIALLLSTGTAATPGYSQTNPTNAQLTKQFQDGFMKGCLQGKTPGVKSQPSYCNCMVKGYQSRYDGRQLSAISQLSSAAGERGPALVNLMMAPEAKACTARS